MTDSRSVFRVGALVVIVGVGVTLLAVGVALSRVRVEGPTTGLTEACGVLLSRADLTAAAILGITLLAAAAVVRSVLGTVRLVRRTRRVTAALPIEGTIGPASIVADDRINAFCAGVVHPRVFVTRGAVAMLNERELAAVIAHELHHARRRDPMRIVAARAAADGLFFLPVLPRIFERYADLAEVDADRAAIRETGDRAALASALLAFDERSGGTHGVTPTRVDSLGGIVRSRRVSGAEIAVTVVSASTIGGLVAGAAALATTAHVPMPAMALHGTLLLVLAALPAVVPATLRGRRRGQRRSRSWV